MQSGTKNAVMGVAVVAMLGFAGYRLFLRPSGKFVPPKTLTQKAVCLNCKQNVEIERSFSAQAPYKCPACDQVAAYPWFYCYDCAHRFVPKLVRIEGQPPRIPPGVRCPHCGCTNIAGYDPENPQQSPVADAKLPKWP